MVHEGFKFINWINHNSVGLWEGRAQLNDAGLWGMVFKGGFCPRPLIFGLFPLLLPGCHQVSCFSPPYPSAMMFLKWSQLTMDCSFGNH